MRGVGKRWSSGVPDRQREATAARPARTVVRLDREAEAAAFPEARATGFRGLLAGNFER
jgi:hypothetical protein